MNWGLEGLHGKHGAKSKWRRTGNLKRSKHKASTTYVPLDWLLHNTKCCTTLSSLNMSLNVPCTPLQSIKNTKAIDEKGEKLTFKNKKLYNAQQLHSYSSQLLRLYLHFLCMTVFITKATLLALQPI